MVNSVPGCLAQPDCFVQRGMTLLARPSNRAHPANREMRARLNDGCSGRFRNSERLIGRGEGVVQVATPGLCPCDGGERFGFLDGITGQSRQRQYMLSCFSRSLKLTGDEKQVGFCL